EAMGVEPDDPALAHHGQGQAGNLLPGHLGVDGTIELVRRGHGGNHGAEREGEGEEVKPHARDRSVNLYPWRATHAGERTHSRLHPRVQPRAGPDVLRTHTRAE